MKNQQKHCTNRNSQTEKVPQQELLKHKMIKSIEEISWILREQRKNACGKKMPEHLEQETTEEQGAMSIDVTNNPFTFCVCGNETASQTQTEKPKRGARSEKGRGNRFLSLQGSPIDVPQPKMQDE
jgi:hypothetical protein